MRRVRFSGPARDDLREIRRYVGRDNPRAALRLVGELHSACRKLGQFPEMGRARDDLAPGLRGFPVSTYLIIYREDETGIEIYRIIHGARDLGQLFS
jgi:toxin ParE1/3/4